jgi:hypothetical protein
MQGCRLARSVSVSYAVVLVRVRSRPPYAVAVDAYCTTLLPAIQLCTVRWLVAGYYCMHAADCTRGSPPRFHRIGAWSTTVRESCVGLRITPAAACESNVAPLAFGVSINFLTLD